MPGAVRRRHPGADQAPARARRHARQARRCGDEDARAARSQPRQPGGAGQREGAAWTTGRARRASWSSTAAARTASSGACVGRGLTVLRVPWDYDFLDEDFDGVVISNGPGDPKMCGATIEHVRRRHGAQRPDLRHLPRPPDPGPGRRRRHLQAEVRPPQPEPALRPRSAPSAATSPRRTTATRSTSAPCPTDWEPWFRNANDGTNEGIRHRTRPVHERAVPSRRRRPGRVDTTFLFDEFVADRCDGR